MFRSYLNLRPLVWTSLLSLIAGVLGLATMARINDLIVKGINNASLLILGGLVVATWGFRLFSETSLLGTARKVNNSIRLDLTSQITAVPLQDIERLGTAPLFTALTADVATLSAIIPIISLVLVNLTLLSTSAIYLVATGGRLGVIVILCMAVGALLFNLIRARARHSYEEARQAQEDIIANIELSLAGIKESKLNQLRRQAQLEQLVRCNTRIQDAIVKGDTAFITARVSGRSIFFIVIGVILVMAGSTAGMSKGLVYSSITLILFLMGPLEALMQTVPLLLQGRVALRRIESLGLTLKRCGPEVLDTRLQNTAFQKLILRQIIYRYTTPEAESFNFGPVDLTMEASEIVLVVGGNGSGKTTLMKVFTGLYAPASGEIRFNDELITDANRDAYRQQFSVVFSDFCLFEDLITTNQCDLREKVSYYLKQFKLDHKVTILNDRFSTTALSQGQRKRLALLTAYLEDRPIYVFDEWAADQDPEFRHLFYTELLPELKQRNKCVIAITHDDRYFHVADRIIKLEYGKVVQNLVLHQQTLGDILVHNNVLSHEQLRQAIDEPSELHEKFGEKLIRLGFATPMQVREALFRQLTG